MFKITDVFTLDATKQNSQYTVVARKNDTRTREIRVAITNASKSVCLDGCSAIINAKKPDETVVYSDCEIFNNYVICTLPSSMLAADGIVACELVVYGADSQQLTSPRFEIIVESTLYDEDAIESTDDYTALISALAEVQKFKNVSAEAETIGSTYPATASVEVTETGIDFSFGIPRGEQGPAGPGSGDMSTYIYDTRRMETDIFQYVDDHKNDTDNPHAVTAAQVGADVLGAAAAVQENITAHAGNKSNPHEVTAEQANAVGVLRGTAIAANSDMNNYTVDKAGVYYVQNKSEAETINNLAYTGGSSIVEVRQTAASDTCMQIQYASGDANIPVYIRRYNGSAWGEWVKWNNLTAEDVGAVSNEVLTGTVVETGVEWTDNNTVIKKSGNVVHLFVEVTKIRDTNATSYIMTLPEGFRPARKITFAYNAINKTSTSDLTLDVDGVLTYVFVNGGIQATVYRGYLSFTTI